MNRKRTSPIPEPIAQLQRQLDQFRSTQTGWRRLPESLWQAAVTLARQYGVYSVQPAPRLDYIRLKKRLGGTLRLRRKAAKPAFVELIAPPPTMLEDCVIRVFVRRQDAHPVENRRAARLGQPAACLAGNGRTIQITTQMRVLHRKNALFYRTLNGAQVGDLFMSLIRTCQLCGVNSFDCLTEFERHAREPAAHAAEWMPWNYRQTLQLHSDHPAAPGSVLPHPRLCIGNVC